MSPDNEYIEEQALYPRDLFHLMIANDSPYAPYIFQWVPYQTEAKRYRLKMFHDVKTFDCREEHGVYPNANKFGSFEDHEIEFIRISKNQSWLNKAPIKAGTDNDAHV